MNGPTSTKPIVLASDHAGFRLKEAAKEILQGRGIEVVDFGTDSEASVDYPDYAERAIRSIVEGGADRGILVCGSGIGMSIVANRFPGVRAALACDPRSAEMSRRHNDANVLVLRGREMDRETAEKTVLAWLETDFEGGRHLRRLEKIAALEKRILAGR